MGIIVSTAGVEPSFGHASEGNRRPATVEGTKNRERSFEGVCKMVAGPSSRNWIVIVNGAYGQTRGSRTTVGASDSVPTDQQVGVSDAASEEWLALGAWSTLG